jgi:hypothetical protein
MGQVVPFKAASFDPETIQLMDAALAKARRAIRLPQTPAAAELLAGRIIEFTRRGETDPDRICIQALAALGYHQPSDAL